MMNRTVLTFFIVLCLSSASFFSALAFEIQPLKAVVGTVYIRADGRVEGTTSIQTTDNVTYVLLANINDSIVVERDSIIIDGEGHTVQGSGSGNGFYWSGISNVTVKNTSIKGFHSGIYVWRLSSNNSISGNSITNNSFGIYLRSSWNNSISGNNITANNIDGINLLFSRNNSISGNSITNNANGISLCTSLKDNIGGNSITNNGIGIWFDCSDYESISGNSITDNDYVGIYFDTTYNDPPSNYNSISGNSIANNGIGIDLSSSSKNNSISGNNITANNGYGISIYSSSKTRISGNTFTNDGLAILYSYQNFVEGNTVNGKPLVYLEGVTDYSVSDAGQVILVNCDSIIVEDLNLSNASRGVQLLNTTNSIIARNSIANSLCGVSLYSSSNTSISGNNIANNGVGIDLSSSSNNNSISENNITNNDNGVHLNSSSNNNVYHSNFVENTRQVHSEGSMNVWDDGYPSGGNYWSDYNGTDANHDGIGDTPYTIDGNNRDNHPLITPYVLSEYLQFLYMREGYSSLLASFNGLNASYQQHLLDFSALEADCSKLREELDSLNKDYVSLDSSYQALNSSYNSLNASFNEYKTFTQSELAYAKNLEYALTATTVILLAAIIYVVLRKPQIKSETQRPLQSTEEK